LNVRRRSADEGNEADGPFSTAGKLSPREERWSVLTVKRASPMAFLILAIVVAELLVFMPTSIKKQSELMSDFVLPPSGANLSIKGFRAVHVNQEGQKEIIKASEAELYRKEGFSYLKNVDLTIFSKRGQTIFVHGLAGKHFLETKDVELTDQITVNSENLGYELKTNYLKYEAATNFLSSWDKVEVVGPNPKEPSLTVLGRGLEGNTKTQEFKILNDVRCQKFDVKADAIDIESGEAEFFFPKNEALFQNNVIVKQKDMIIYADHFLVNYNGQNRGIDKAKAYANVKIVQGDRVATCDRAYLLNREQKIVLVGRPKVTQANDVVEAKVVIFYTAQNKIVFDDAIGEMDVKKVQKLEE